MFAIVIVCILIGVAYGAGSEVAAHEERRSVGIRYRHESKDRRMWPKDVHGNIPPLYTAEATASCSSKSASDGTVDKSPTLGGS